MKRYPVIFTMISLLFSAQCLALTEVEKEKALSEVQKAMASLKHDEAIPTRPVKDVAGIEWLQMSLGDRMDAILASMTLLTKNGVPLDGSPNDYYNMVDEKLRNDPSYYNVTVTQILANIIYGKEAQAREALDKLKK